MRISDWSSDVCSSDLGEVLQALGEDPMPILARRKARVPSPEDASLGGGSGTYSIDSRARLSNGRQATLRVVVRAGIGIIPGSSYTALRGEQAATASRCRRQSTTSPRRLVSGSASGARAAEIGRAHV